MRRPNSIHKALLAAAVLFGLQSVMAAPAETKGSNTAESKASSESVGWLETLALADKLAEYGIRNADAAAIVQAAKMKRSIPQQPLQAAKQTEGAGPANEGSKSTGYDLSADALLTRAEGMAQDNAVVKRLIAEARVAKSRQAVGGPKTAQERLLGGRTDVYTIDFVGGQPAAVGVVGDGDTDLDLYVYDENGNRVCSDTDYTDKLLCRWTPRWSGPFKIKIRNLGNVYNVYRLRTN